MTQKERDERLKELNRQCEKCIADADRNFEKINPKSCLAFCQIGREVHNLENPEWDKQDWNSSKLENLYHN